MEGRGETCGVIFLACWFFVMEVWFGNVFFGGRFWVWLALVVMICGEALE